MSKPAGRTLAALGLDVGTKRVGVAATDSAGITVQPLEVVNRSPDTDALRRVLELCREREVEVIVTGLPLGLSGREGPAVWRTRRFTEKVRRTLDRLDRPIEMVEWDERLTTVAAEQALRSTGNTSRSSRKVVDAVAAALILESWLGSVRRGSE